MCQASGDSRIHSDIFTAGWEAIHAGTHSSAPLVFRPWTPVSGVDESVSFTVLLTFPEGFPHRVRLTDGVSRLLGKAFLMSASGARLV